jgi:predicted metalloprotease with PDZ domain
MSQQQQARYYNRGARNLPLLEESDSVRIKPWKLGKKEWQLGSVRKRLDERSYEVQTPCGILRRNRIHYDVSHILPSCLLFIAKSRKYHPVVVLLHNHKWLKKISTKFHQVLKQCSVFYLR